MEKDENFLKSKNKSKFILNIKSMELGDFSISIFKDKNTQVINIKEQIYTEKSIELNHQRLIYLGKLLQDSQTLDELKLTNNNTLHLVKSSPNENGSNNNLLQNISQNQNIILNTIRNHNNTLGEILNVLNIIENTDSNMIYRNNSDTFVQLIQTRAPFNFEKSSEVLIQNVLNIKNLINTHIQLEKNAKNNSKVKSSFLLNSAQFRVGQWVDVSDCFDVWSESQITKIEQNKALVKMTGLNNLTNINRNSRTEWIPLDSERLRPLRTKTVQNPFSMYLSPCISFNNNQIQNDNNLVFSGTNNKKDERVLYINDLVEFLDVLRP